MLTSNSAGQMASRSYRFLVRQGLLQHGKSLLSIGPIFRIEGDRSMSDRILWTNTSFDSCKITDALTDD
jgi:hypothetical protein